MTSVPPNPVLEAVVDVGHRLPSSVVEKVAFELETVSAPATSSALRSVLSVVRQGQSRDLLSHLFDKWLRDYPELPPRVIAWSLRSAAAADARRRREQELELVWTGPVPPGSTLRRTDQALLELIRCAERTLLVATFAAYRVESICEALIAAAHRGVRLTYVVESPEASDGRVTFDPMKAFPVQLADAANVYVWPLEERHRDDRGRHGTLC